MIQIKMNVPSRLMALSNLPEKADVYTMIITRQLRQIIDFNADEITLYEIKRENDSITWDSKKDFENIIDREFSNEQITLLIKMFDTLNDDKMIVDSVLDFVMDLFNHRSEITS